MAAGIGSYSPSYRPRTPQTNTGTVRSGSVTTSYRPTAWHAGRLATERYGPDPLDVYRRFRAEGGFGGGDETAAGTLPSRVAGVSPADRRAAEDAAFARAKERVGATTQGLLRSIQNTMARRGIQGSGIEGELTERALTGGAGQLGEVARDQAIEGLRRAQAIEDRDYAGGIAQRGQEIPLLQQRRGQALDALRLIMGRY